MSGAPSGGCGHAGSGPAPAPAGRAAEPPRLAVLACSVFEREIALLAAGAAHIVETRWFEIGLHDQPGQLRATLQESIDVLDTRTDIDAIVLAYGLCGRGTAGLRTGRQPLVLPRAHDCVTLFMGSHEAYAAHQRRCPTCYYYTPGWNRARRVPGPDRLRQLRAEYAARFEPDDVEFLLETEQEQWLLHDRATFLDLGTADAVREADYARSCAAALGWAFEHLRGDPTLLRDLLWGRWTEDRFLRVAPGLQVAHVADARIVRAAPADQEVQA